MRTNCIVIDNGYSFSLDSTDALRLGVKAGAQITEKEIEDLVFIYENCNILNADAIRERLKPIIDKKKLEKLSLETYNQRNLQLIQLINVFSAGENVIEGQFMQNKYTTTCSSLYKALYSNAMLNIGEDTDEDGIMDEKYLDREDMCDVIKNLKFEQEYELSRQVDKLVMTTSYGCKISIIEPSKQMDLKVNMAFSALRALIVNDKENSDNKSWQGTIAVRYSYGENNSVTPVVEYYAE